jgi:hypothetical protein
MAVSNTNELERVRYWQGQLLASGDLETQLRVDEEMRRLHNRDVHQAYGIAIGLELETDQATPPNLILDEGANLHLGCGMAYDCAGRELILQSDRMIPLPSEFPMSLVLSRDQASVDGVALRWKAPAKVNPNSEVVITTLIAGGMDPKVDPKFSEVVARPLARPRMATGQTIPGQTTWQLWKIDETDIGVKVDIDTSAAGFTRPPHYFAEVIPGNPTKDFIPAWFASIAKPTTRGFTLQLMLKGITRESFDIADPKGQVTSAPTLDKTVTLDKSNLFERLDSVARVLPLAEKVALIKTLSAGNATLAFDLDALPDSKLAAFGNIRREAIVKKTSPTQSFFEATVDHPERFSAGNVVVKLNGTFESSRPGRVVSVDDNGTLELQPHIMGLAVNDTIAVAQPASTVKTISPNGTEITVNNATLYLKDDVVVRLEDPIETSAPAKITEKKGDGTLVLSNKIKDLAVGESLGVARGDSLVLDLVDNSSEIKIEVDDVRPFRKGDLVTKDSKDGKFSPPVRVQRVFTSTNVLTLSGSISNLELENTIVAADFPVRATVTALDSLKSELTVKDPSLFPAQSYVARIDNLLSAGLPAAVISSTNKVTINDAIAGLNPGDVIGLVSFPATVEVSAVRDDGSIEVSRPDLLRRGDFVTALSKTQPAKRELGLVVKITGNEVRFAGTPPPLSANDRLTVASIRGAVKVTRNNGVNSFEIDQPRRVRVGDFLANISGWRQVQESVDVLTAGNSTTISLNSLLDGLLLEDIVGLASIVKRLFGFMLLRLNKPLELRNSDQVVLIGFDRLKGEKQTLSASVWFVIPETNTVFLQVLLPSNLTLRPEDVAASVSFVRGDPLALIQKDDLFVSWLAVGEPDRMPRLCDGTDLADCECSQVKE